jgi:Putative prokaryotic signal transducing protein
MKTTRDLVRVADGDLVRMEMYQQGLKEAGIESRVVGEELEAGLGTAIPGSVELWVHRSDAEKAAASIARMEAERARPPRDHPAYPRPMNDPKPSRPVGHGPHTHYDSDPRS